MKQTAILTVEPGKRAHFFYTVTFDGKVIGTRQSNRVYTAASIVRFQEAFRSRELASMGPPPANPLPARRSGRPSWRQQITENQPRVHCYSAKADRARALGMNHGHLELLAVATLPGTVVVL